MSKKLAAKLKDAIVVEPDIAPVDGSARVVRSIKTEKDEIDSREPGRLLDYLLPQNGTELLAAPRVTVFSERSESETTPRPASDSFYTPFEDTAVIADFVTPLRRNVAIIADTVSYPSKVSPVSNSIDAQHEPGSIFPHSQWSGIVAGVSLDLGDRPGTVAADLAFVNRQQLRRDGFHDIAFRFQLDMPLGSPTWFTATNNATGERIFVQVTVDLKPEEADSESEPTAE